MKGGFKGDLRIPRPLIITSGVLLTVSIPLFGLSKVYAPLEYAIRLFIIIGLLFCWLDLVQERKFGFQYLKIFVWLNVFYSLGCLGKFLVPFNTPASGEIRLIQQRIVLTFCALGFMYTSLVRRVSSIGEDGRNHENNSMQDVE